MARNIVKVYLVFIVVISSVSAIEQEGRKDLNRRVSEKYLGKIDFSSWIEYSFTVSPDKRHIAYVFKRDYDMFVIVDGEEKTKYDSIWGVGFRPPIYGRGSFCNRLSLTGYDREPIFSPNSKKIAHVVQKGTKKFAVVNEIEEKRYDDICNYQFSPNSQSFAYIAQESGKIFVVINGVEGKRYDDVYWLSFSSDSKRFAYVARENGRKFIVVDGKEKKQYSDIYNVIYYTFSPDSRRVAYVAEGDRAEDFVVINDVKGKTYNPIGEFVFSPNSQRFAYETTDGSKSFVVIDGKEWRKYSSPPYHSYRILFSPDSKRVAFIVKGTNKEFVVADGIEGKRYNSIYGKIYFSPDNKRLAYIAKDAGKTFVVVDGTEHEKHYENLNKFTFSPNSRKLFYIAKAGNKWFLVVDGIEGKKYDYVFDPVFSPDGSRVAYGVQEGENEPYQYFVVVDGIEGKKYDDVESITFSPDSKRVAYMARKGKKSFVVIGSKEGVKYDYVEEVASYIEKIIFDSPDKLHYIAMKGNKIYLIKENIAQEY